MLLDTQPYKVPAIEQPIEPWRQLLLDGADLIERTSWWNGKSLKRPTYCVLTAICSASINNRVMLQAGVNFSNYVGMGSETTIPDWNDAPGRTKEEVLTAMRGAARS